MYNKPNLYICQKKWFKWIYIYCYTHFFRQFYRSVYILKHSAYLLGVLVDQIQVKRYLESSFCLLQFFSSEQCSTIWSLPATMTLNSILFGPQSSTGGENLIGKKEKKKWKVRRAIVSVNKIEVRYLKCTWACLLDFSLTVCAAIKDDTYY